MIEAWLGYDDTRLSEGRFAPRPEVFLVRPGGIGSTDPGIERGYARRGGVTRRGTPLVLTVDGCHHARHRARERAKETGETANRRALYQGNVVAGKKP